METAVSGWIRDICGRRSFFVSEKSGNYFVLNRWFFMGEDIQWKENTLEKERGGK